jgi:transcriptional regulator with XRE-family HTH domain
LKLVTTTSDQRSQFVPPVHYTPDAYVRAGRRVTLWRLHQTDHGTPSPMTQQDLAARAHVSIGCLQGFESGKRNTRLDRVKKIAAAVGMTIEQLMAPDDPVPVVDNLADLTEEAIDVARMFTLAHTEVRMEIKQQLRAHLSARTDRLAVTFVERHREHPSKEVQSPAVNGGTGPTFRTNNHK